MRRVVAVGGQRPDPRKHGTATLRWQRSAVVPGLVTERVELFGLLEFENVYETETWDDFERGLRPGEQVK